MHKHFSNWHSLAGILCAAAFPLACQGYADEPVQIELGDDHITINKSEKLSVDSLQDVKDQLIKVNAGKSSTLKQERSTHTSFLSLGIILLERVGEQPSAAKDIYLPVVADKDFPDLRFRGALKIREHRLDVLTDIMPTRADVGTKFKALGIRESDYSPQDMDLKLNSITVTFHFSDASSRPLDYISISLRPQPAVGR